MIHRIARRLEHPYKLDGETLKFEAPKFISKDLQQQVHKLKEKRENSVRVKNMIISQRTEQLYFYI